MYGIENKEKPLHSMYRMIEKYINQFLEILQNV